MSNLFSNAKVSYKILLACKNKLTFAFFFSVSTTNVVFPVKKDKYFKMHSDFKEREKEREKGRERERRQR